MRLEDGRTLAWSEWGNRDGLPVLFCTGAAMSGYLGFGAAEVDELGIRLLAVDRPGLGSSDPHPGKTFASWTDDMRQLISRCELRGATAVGFSQGAPFALALAADGLAVAAAVVSGQDELAHPSLAPLLHPDVNAMVEAVRLDAAAFEQYFAGMATEDGLWQLIRSMSAECDRAVYANDRFGEALRRALREGFAQGAAGYARDLVNAMGSWPFRLEQVRAPVDLWYGLKDTSTVHSPDFGATMHARLPSAFRIADPDEGGSILWTRSRDILARLSLRGAQFPLR
jgi:pimeloyl-ACP methyl ester carboxylesterase